MRLLITGGAGFIGSQHVRALLRGELGTSYELEQVTVLDALTYAGHRENLDPVAADPRLQFVHADIRDDAALDQVLPGHDAVINYAAESHVDRSIAGAADFVTTNVGGVQTLLDACRRHGVSRVVQVSTDEVYGSVAHGATKVGDPLNPSSPYSAAKAGGDLIALAYHHTFDMHVVVTRCTNNYGPYQHPEKVIPLFITRMLDGGTVPLYGDGLNERDWLHVADHVRGVQLALDRGTAGSVFHFGGGTLLSNRELTQRLLDACGREWADTVVAVADRLGHDRRYCLDPTESAAALGWTAEVDFETGLAATVDWYRDNQQWWRPLVGT